MEKTLTKYCIMSEDLTKIEVGLSRNYYFANLDDIFNGKCKAQIKFFSTLSMAKRAFSASFGKIWDEELQCFRNRCENYYTDRYVIKEVKVTYDFN